jgi:exosome complex RNA-binding protein Rrp42 (RNase PH superfamily)
MSNKETMLLEDVPVETVVRELGDVLPYAFVHIGDRFVNPQYINSVEDVIVNRSIVESDEIKPGESIVISGHQTFTVVDIYGVEYMRVDGTAADQINLAIVAALKK